MTKKNLKIVKKDIHNFFNEDIIIMKLDYYFSKSISRASKTMSECRKLNQKFKKTELIKWNIYNILGQEIYKIFFCWFHFSFCGNDSLVG